MSESGDKTTEGLLGCGLGLALIVPMTILRGWVVATLWQWLVVPVFHLTSLSVWQAIGLSTIVGIFTMKAPDNDDESAMEHIVRGIVYGLLCYGASLAIGYVVAGQIGGQ